MSQVNPIKVSAARIAREVGVSQMTVSRALTGKGAIAATTRQRILDAAQRLGYRPNVLASGLRGGATRSIGVIVKGLAVPMAAWYVHHMIHAAREQGYLAYTLNIDQYGDDSAVVAEMARDLLDRGVDGLIIFRGLPVSPEVRRHLESCGVPVVYWGWGPSQSQRRVVLDLGPSLHQLADHLAQLGHRRVAYFPSTGQADFPEAKLRPLQRACAAVGIDLLMDSRWWIDGVSGHVADAARDATRLFLADRPADVTALLMINDVGAMGALTALREAGVSVPGDLSLVGFDDIDGSQHCLPPLTTIRAPGSRAVGAAAFEMLHTLIADPDADVQRRVFPFELIVRESTGPARNAISSDCNLISDPDTISA